jgi:hypothetical protein
VALYNVTVRAEFTASTIEKLTHSGVYWVQGAADDPSTMRRRHHLRVQADNCDDAVERARKDVEDAGGDGALIECGGPVFT